MKRLIVGLLAGILLASTGTATAFMIPKSFSLHPYSRAKLTRIVDRQRDAIIDLNADVRSLASCMALPDGKETECLEGYGWNVP